MNSLPTELHIAIASHLTPPSLANYRLTNKRATIIGAEIIFQTFTCRLTPATLERMHHILASPHARFVHKISYDGSGGDDEHREREMRVFSLLLRGFRESESERVKCLEAQNLSLSAFSPRIRKGDKGFFPCITWLTHVSLSFTSHACNPVTPANRLRKFLRGLSDLRELGLRFCGELFWKEGYGYRLSEVIDVGHVWSQLKKLEIGHVHVCEWDLTTLLRNHKGSLEFVSLECVALDVEGEWKERAWRNVLGVLEECERLWGACIEEVIRQGEEEDASGVENREVGECKVRVGEREVGIRTNLGKCLEGWGE
jgi:hypothetical protein